MSVAGINLVVDEPKTPHLILNARDTGDLGQFVKIITQYLKI